MSRTRKLGWLLALYFVQGLPFGFQASALPIYLRDQGVSLRAIGWASMLALPWLAKVLWAPVVDAVWSPRVGRRRSWILPMQIHLAGTCLALALTQSLTPLLVLVFAANLFAATMDVAVDGLAVSLLQENELGLGNTAQVVGFKLGMLTGGGLLVAWSATLGWQGLFVAMAGLIVAVAAFTVFQKEPAETAVEAAGDTPPVGRTILRLLADRRVWALLIVVATYKLGESFADAMFKPFLLDRGYTVAQIGLWLGTWGMVFSLVGSVVGGLLASRFGLFPTLVFTASVRVVPLIGQLLLARDPELGDGVVIAVTSAEHFFGGALTTAMFAFMMSRVDPRIGGTHFTLLASVEVLGKLPIAPVAGEVAHAYGYLPVFTFAVVASVLYLPLLALVRKSPHPRPAEF
ncbi:MAG: MFS transporter [Sandaracinus sp.]|nr:MFS transporter [Sandaracinus sp.]|tara:strand:- start:655 stop:1863 length:1209 start_codon:yes stop_codon:yes gene_type:complete